MSQKKTTSTSYDLFPNALVKHPTSIKRYVFLLSLWLFCLDFFCVAFSMTSYANEPADIPPKLSQGQDKSNLISSNTFDFHDVFQLELNLDIPGNVKIIAIDEKEQDKDTISVSLEKQASSNDSPLVMSYLENLTMTGIKKNGILEIKSHLPVEFDASVFENNSESDIRMLLQLNYAIKTPPDLAVKLNMRKGDVYIHHLRGKIEITSEASNVQLDETLGNYDIEVNKGRIHGKILFSPGQNVIKTDNGSIDLTVLDDLAAPLELIANGGKIDLLLPDSYAADVELQNDKQNYVINLPAEMENNKGKLNKGGPLLKLTATDDISVKRNPWLPKKQEENSETTLDDISKRRIEQPVPFTEKPPKIDGNLTEKVWSNAVTLSAFQNPLGTELAENTTDVQMMWDSENLYIGARVNFTTYQIPRVSQTQRDSPIWLDDSIEFLIDMNPETEAYAHIVLNPIGGVYDQRVRAAGYPNYRFAPDNVKRKQIDDTIEKFKYDSSWESKAKIATKINTTYWSFEIAYPLNDGESNDKNECLFNIHRKAIGIVGETRYIDVTEQQEFSYWLPMYDEEYPWWPHWKEGMGLLKLLRTQPTVTSDLDVPANMQVERIEIAENLKIPSEVIIKNLPIAIGETITNEQLSWMISELEKSDKFSNVQVEISVSNQIGYESSSENQLNTPQEELLPEGVGHTEQVELSENVPLKVTLRIKVTENPLNYAKRIIISNNKIFPSLFIREWFDLTLGYLPVTNVKLKQDMMTDFYMNRGYSFAKVNYKYNDDILQIQIDEGTLDEIRFTGNNRISNTELSDALEIDSDRVFSETHAQASITRMSKKLTQTNKHFKSIEHWHAQHEGGRNILIIEIKEQSIVKPGWYPILGFNRVHGLILGAGGNLTTDFTGDEQIFGTLSGGFASRILNYSFGVEKRFFETYPLAFGVGMFKLTDISTNAFRDFPVDPNLTAAAYGIDSADYYQRDGQQFWFAQSLGNSSIIRLETTFEDHDNLSKSTDWSYYDRSRIKRDNARIDTGPMNSFFVGYAFDTRDIKTDVKRPQFMGTNLIPWPNERTKRGWRGNLGVEIAGAMLGGDFSYSLYKFSLVRYNRIYGGHHVNIRLSGHFSNDPLPKQRYLYLGGSATLRGYDFNTFAGDKRILLNLEYRFIAETKISTNPDVLLGMALYTFMDTGQVWWYNEDPISEFALNELKTSVGVGLSFFLSPPEGFQPLSTAFEVAAPINIDAEYRQLRFIWRLERMF